MQEIVSGSADTPLVFVVRRGDQEVTLPATPRLREVESALGKIAHRHAGPEGVDGPGRHPRGALSVLSAALGRAVEETWTVIGRTGSYLGGLVTGRESADQLSGPIGIAQVSGQMAQAIVQGRASRRSSISSRSCRSRSACSISSRCRCSTADICCSLRIEAVRGRALNERTQEVAFRLGLAMVGTLMIFSTYNDLARLIGRLTGGAS